MPHLTGQALLQAMADTPAPPASATMWWLGQMGFAIKLRGLMLYIDAYLSESEHRLMPPPLRPAEIANADLVFGTHDHSDHIDRCAWPLIAGASPKCRFVVPRLHVENLSQALNIPLARFIGVDDGETVDLHGLRVTGIAAAHEILSPDPATGRHPFLGYILEHGGIAIYHAGDTCKYDGLETRLKCRPLAAAVLPINGRDALRLSSGCIGNMVYQEAADLAGAIKPKITIPGHFGMFTSNTEDPQKFFAYMRVKYPDLRVAVPHLAEPLVITA